MRLTTAERTMLKVLENALEVSEYTDVVDVTFSHNHKTKMSRILESLVDILSISSGLLLATNLVKGEGMIKGRNLNDNVELFRKLFEIGRRFKIMNPAKFRNTYGKLMFILMDTESGPVKQDLKLDMCAPILTVRSFLHSKGALALLDDEEVWLATKVIENHHGAKSRGAIESEAKAKAAATERLLNKYSSNELTKEDVSRVLESLSDNNAFLSYNVHPVDAMLSFLTSYFDPKKPSGAFSLSLSQRSSGLGFTSLYSRSSGGAMLSHDHSTQFNFVLQSLTLWREIMVSMPKLWCMADLDLCEQPYRLANTGQGYHRLQSCPHVGAAMRQILANVQKKFSSWVGLSVVHLGDRDVPNALVFIDKYTQVPFILTPIVRCIEKILLMRHEADRLNAKDAAFLEYIQREWTSLDNLILAILSDFFKHGFDGSGDDGGSCIDGRLTSAWNWCSKLHKKPFYLVFMYTGFQGFDGDWGKE